MRIYRHRMPSAAGVLSTLLTIPGPSAGKMCFLRRVWVPVPTDATLAAGQSLSLQIRYLPATVTLGTGGTGTITPDKADPGDAACSITTARYNDFTTQATTGGTAIVLWKGGVHLYQGLDLIFQEGSRPQWANGTAITLDLLAAPSGTVTLACMMEFGEVG